MSPIPPQAELSNLSIRLSEEQKANPYGVLDDFFIDYKLPELRESLWEIVETCLTTDQHPFCSAERRANLLLYYSKIEELLEANFILLQRQQALEKQKKSKGPQ